MLRRHLLAVPALLAAGCASNEPPSYFKAAPFVALQDPLPGQAVVYLLRAPHDRDVFSMEVSGKRLFTLPPGTFTVLSVSPGPFRITGTTTSFLGGVSSAFMPAEFSIQNGQRAFLYVSGDTQRSFDITGVMPLGKAGVMLQSRSGLSTEAGTRTWKECSEVDAQGFISISKLKHVE
jgi:hypothetical protein